MKPSFITKIFGKKIEQKSYNQISQLGSLGYAIQDALYGDDTMDADKAMKYYQDISAVSNSIEMIASEVEGFRPYIFDGKQYTRDNDLIRLLDSPIMNDSSSDFLGAICRYYTITKNAYIIATGPIGRAPLELEVVPPQSIGTKISNSDGRLEYITVNSPSGARVFKRQVIKSGALNGKERFLHDSSNSEIWPINGFSLDKTASNGQGVSDLKAVQYEIKQFLNSNIHNTAMLKNGANIMGILSFKDATIDSMDALKEQFNRSYSGSNNAHKTFITNGDVDFKNLSMSLKDMDFIQLKKNVERIIYNKFRIPLPLVLEDSMTLDNLRQAKGNLYYFAVLPKINLIFKQLTLFLGPRFGLSSDEIVTYKPDEIAVLRRDAIDETLILQQTGVFSDNEIRARLGYDRYPEGDTIYKPSNLLPAGEDVNFTDNTDNARDDKAAKKPFSQYLIEADIESKANRSN